MNSVWRGIQTAKDYLFPVFCLSCSEEGVWICNACKQFLRVEAQLFCPVCHAKTEKGEPCHTCQSSALLTQHIAMMKYIEDALVGKMIHVFKYQHAEEVMKVITDIIFVFVSQYSELYQDIDVILPVPLHKKRYAERGFNQATYIARALSDVLEKPLLEHALIRSRHTPHQAKLDRTERLKNVEGAFVLADVAQVAGKRILLVDDVYTTGATMQACAQVLLGAGAIVVSGCTFARG